MVAIMQGRLLPPRGGRFQAFPGPDWPAEFHRAAALGIEAIEWVYDVTGVDDDPLQNGAGVTAIADVCRTSGVAVRSICADWFMSERLAARDPAERQAARRRLVEQLLPAAEELGIERVVLPFVDSSTASGVGGLEAVVAALSSVLPAAAHHRVELHLETDLDPQTFRTLLDALDSPWVAVNYDIGNSASLGFDPREEFAAYGHRLGSVHIKDRPRGAATVPLGSGDADFAAVRRELARLGFHAPFVLQAARGDDGDELAWIDGVLDRAGVLLGPDAARRVGAPTLAPVATS